MWYVVFLFIVAPLMLTKEWSVSPGAALSVVTLTPSRHWAAAVLIWLPLLVGIAVSAVASGVSTDRDGDGHARLLAAA